MRLEPGAPRRRGVFGWRGQADLCPMDAAGSLPCSGSRALAGRGGSASPLPGLLCSSYEAAGP